MEEEEELGEEEEKGKIKLSELNYPSTVVYEVAGESEEAVEGQLESFYPLSR